MEDKYYQVILEKYKNKESDFGELFRAVLAIGDEVGLERALGYLEERLEKMERMGKLLTKRIRKW